jgi:hypothetical protein
MVFLAGFPLLFSDAPKSARTYLLGLLLAFGILLIRPCPGQALSRRIYLESAEEDVSLGGKKAQRNLRMDSSAKEYCTRTTPCF